MFGDNEDVKNSFQFISVRVQTLAMKAIVLDAMILSNSYES